MCWESCKKNEDFENWFYTVAFFDSLQITESSVEWVGAWWLGFLIGGFVSLIVGMLLLGFPKYLPSKCKVTVGKRCMSITNRISYCHIHTIILCQ